MRHYVRPTPYSIWSGSYLAETEEKYSMKIAKKTLPYTIQDLKDLCGKAFCVYHHPWSCPRGEIIKVFLKKNSLTLNGDHSFIHHRSSRHPRGNLMFERNVYGHLLCHGFPIFKNYWHSHAFMVKFRNKHGIKT